VTDGQHAAQVDAPALDLLVPRYHITGDRNWINDPNGPIHWDGVYHLFFQANPDAPRWGPPQWGHVSSRDLVRWRRHPMALNPSQAGPDRDGCWSGCARSVGGRPVIYYTGVVGEDDDRVESICRATGSDDLSEWTKDPANPLVPGPPAELGSGYHRDPFLWQDEEGWQLILGSGTLDGQRHGTVIRYRSDDALTWTYNGVLFEGPRHLDGLDLGQHWECPQLLRFGERWVLLISCQNPDAARPLMRTVYFVGALEDGTFRAHSHGILDHGDAFYAPAATVDENGRTIIWGWIQERLPEQLQQALGKVGALSLPRVLDLVGNELRITPAPELVALRDAEVHRGPVDLPYDDTAVALGPASRQLEIETTITASRGRAGLTVELSPDGSENLRVGIDADRGLLVLDRSQASRDPLAPADPIEIPLTPQDGPWRLRILLDGSAVEVFLGDRVALTTRVYPTSRHVGLVRAHRQVSDAELDGAVWHLSTNAVPPEMPTGDAHNSIARTTA